MKNALQYQPTNGIQELLDRLVVSSNRLYYSLRPMQSSVLVDTQALQKKVHSPPRSDWDLVATSGSQDGLCKACEMLMIGEPEGEPVLVEDFVYSGALAIMDPYRPKYLSVAADEKGMRADRLREAIEK